MRPSHTAAECTHIRGLYDIVRKKKNETGLEYYIDRRGLFHSGQLRNDEYLTPTLLNTVRPVKVLTHRTGMEF